MRTARVTTLEVHGELDLSNAEVFEHALRQAHGLDAAQVIVDLRGLDFIDSHGIHALVSGIRTPTSGADQFAVRLGDGGPARVLELAGISTAVRILA